MKLKKVFPLLAISMLVASPVAAMQVKVTIENLAPANGNYFTPVWIGFHDGSFDIYDAGGIAPPAVQRLAEDGNAAPLDTVFQVSTTNGVSSVVTAPNIRFAPGDVGISEILDLDPVDNQYFSYMSMIIPSNDAFIGNGNPTAFQIFNNSGAFQGLDLFVLGNSVMDAGTEVNDEIPANTAFLGQTVPDTGVAERGRIQRHAGFKAKGEGGILDAPMFTNADFTRIGYPVAQIRIENAGEEIEPLAAPVPGAIWMLGSALFGLGGLKRKRK